MPVDRLQRRQEIIDIIKVLCENNYRIVPNIIESKVRELTCNDDRTDGHYILQKWDEDNVNPFLVASFIYTNLDKGVDAIQGAQRTSNVGDAAGNMKDDYTSNFASVGLNYKENARFMTLLGHNMAAQGLNTHLDDATYKSAGNIDWTKQLPLLKRFAVANSVFADDFADVGTAQNFYNDLSQLNTGYCSTVSSVRKTLLAAASLKAGFDRGQTETILANVNDDIDNQYTEDRAQAFKELYTELTTGAGRIDQETAIKKASVIFK